MKQAKIKATKQYHDVELDKLIQIGEEYAVSLERAETIISKGFAVLVEAVEEKPEPAPKKRATRKKKK
jgi:hypothetical protein